MCQQNTQNIGPRNNKVDVHRQAALLDVTDKDLRVTRSEQFFDFLHFKAKNVWGKKKKVKQTKCFPICELQNSPWRGEEEKSVKPGDLK